MTHQPYTRPKHRKLSEAKKRKLWNSKTCDDCGGSTENPITGYKIGKVQLVKDEKICSSCLTKRITALENIKKMLKSGELEL